MTVVASQQAYTQATQAFEAAAQDAKNQAVQALHISQQYDSQLGDRVEQ